MKGKFIYRNKMQSILYIAVCLSVFLLFSDKTDLIYLHFLSFLWLSVMLIVLFLCRYCNGSYEADGYCVVFHKIGRTCVIPYDNITDVSAHTEVAEQCRFHSPVQIH